MTNNIDSVLAGDNCKIIEIKNKFYLKSTTGRCIINDRLTKSDLFKIADKLSIIIRDKKSKKKDIIDKIKSTALYQPKPKFLSRKKSKSGLQDSDRIPNCGNCGKKTKLCNGKYGDFYSCPSYNYETRRHNCGPSKYAKFSKDVKFIDNNNKLIEKLNNKIISLNEQQHLLNKKYSDDFKKIKLQLREMKQNINENKDNNNKTNSILQNIITKLTSIFKFNL
jgi:hypothetical protein